jgi:hypothetical protein
MPNTVASGAPQRESGLIRRFDRIPVGIRYNVALDRKRAREQIRAVTFSLLQKGHDQEGDMLSGRRPHDVLAG